MFYPFIKMDKENVVYTYNEYNLALKKWEILQYSTTWMYLEGMMLISQTQEDRNCIISLT